MFFVLNQPIRGSHKARNGQKWTKIIKIAFSDLTECLNQNVEENKTALELNFTHYMTKSTSLGLKNR